MDALKLITDFWPVFLSGIAFVVWNVKQGGKIDETYRYAQAVDKKYDTLNARHEALESKTLEQLAQVRESLARIEGALGVKPFSNNQ